MARPKRDARVTTQTDDEWRPKPTAPRGAEKYGDRTTSVEATRRVEAIASLLVDGYKRAAICQFVAKNTDWDVGLRQIDRYIADATKLIEAEAAPRIRYRLGQAQQRLDRLYQAAVQAKQFGIALRIQRETNRLLALGRRYEPRTPPPGEPITPTDPPANGAPLPGDVRRADVIAHWVEVARTRGAALPPSGN